MARKRHLDENILRLSREIELSLASVSDVATVSRTAGVSDATYYTWRKRFGGTGRSEMANLKALQKETDRLKKTERLWREEGPQLPRRHVKRKRLCHKDSSIVRLRSRHPNHIWSIDFVHDKLSNDHSLHSARITIHRDFWSLDGKAQWLLCKYQHQEQAPYAIGRLDERRYSNSYRART